MVLPIRKREVQRPDPAAIGEQILETLAAARDRYNAARTSHARDLAFIVAELARQDVAKGFPARGRAGRVARVLRRKFHAPPGSSEPNVRKILLALALRD